MALKISYSRLIWEDMKRRNWLGVCIILGLIFVMPCRLAVNLSEKIFWMNEPGSTYTRKQLLNYFEAMVGYQNRYVSLAVLAGAVACGITGFLYLHAKEKQDFYHSFPLRRERWFLISYVSGALLFLVPYLTCYLLMYLVGAMREVTVEGAAVKFLAVAGYNSLFFLLFYSITILSVMLTGQIAVALLGTGIILGYGSLVVWVGNTLCQQFFETFLPDEMMSNVLQASPPGSYFQSAVQLEAGMIPYHTLIFAGAVLVLTVGTDLLLYRIRPMEAAGHAMAFPKMEGIVKVLISVPAALGVGNLFLYTAISDKKWIMIVSMVSVILACIVIEFIFQLDIRRIVQHKIAALTAVAMTAGVLLVFNFDLIGYNTYLPKENQIESMAMFSNGYRGYFFYADLEYSEKSFLERARTEQFHDIYKLAEHGVENIGTALSTSRPEYVSILFQLKDGKKVYRAYEAEPKYVETTARKLFQSDIYKKQMMPVNHLDTDKIQELYFMDITQHQRRMALTREEVNALFEVLREESGNLTFEEMAYEQPIAIIDAGIAVEWEEDQVFSTTSGSFYVYESFQKTLAMLKAYGFVPEKVIAGEEIEAVYLIEHKGMEELRKEVKDPEERNQILSSIGFGCNGLLNQNFDYAKPVYIEWKSGNDGSYYYFQKGKVPAFI